MLVDIEADQLVSVNIHHEDREIVLAKIEEVVMINYIAILLVRKEI